MFLSKSSKQLNHYLNFINTLVGTANTDDRKTAQEIQELLAAMMVMSMASDSDTLYPLHAASLETVLAYKASRGNDPTGPGLLADAIDKLHACLELDGYKLQSMIQEIRNPAAPTIADPSADAAAIDPAAHTLASRLAALVARPRRHPDPVES